MVRLCRTAVIILLVALAVGSAPAAAGPRPQDRMLSEHITVNGMSRDYLLFIPASYNERGSTHALALVFHGLNNDNTTLTKYVVPTASARGLVVAFPQGIDNSWNAGQCCGGARALNLDDVGFATGLIAALSKRFHPRAVVASGYSNGAMLAWRIACDRSEAIGAVVDASGSQAVPSSGCHPERPLIVTAVHGRQDQTVPYDGGGNTAQLATYDAAPFRPITDVLTEWGHDHNRCGLRTATTWSGGSTTSWVSCSLKVTATLYTIDGMGHDVPAYAAGEPVDFGALIVDAAQRAS